MIDVSTFLVGAAVLLATPGPTNTLLATASAAQGFRRSLPLLAGELGGYAIAISILGQLGPALAGHPLMKGALCAAAAVYLMHVARALWRAPRLALAPGETITPAKVFTTTLFNPKAAIFALVLFPPEAFGGTAAGLAWALMLMPMIVAAGSLWLAIGAFAGRSVQIAKGRWLRVGAVAVAAFAVLLTGRAVAFGISAVSPAEPTFSVGSLVVEPLEGERHEHRGG